MTGRPWRDGLGAHHHPRVQGYQGHHQAPAELRDRGYKPGIHEPGTVRVRTSRSLTALHIRSKPSRTAGGTVKSPTFSAR